MKEIYYELSRKIYREHTIHYYFEKLKLLGNQNTDSIIDFLNIRILLTIVFFFASYLISKGDLFLTVILSFLFYQFFSYFVFDYRIKQREKRLEHNAISFFEVLELALASGKNLIESLKITTTSVDSELSNEFKKTLREIEYGKSFQEAFSDLRKRLPSDAIQNVILNLTETYTSGGKITDNLSKQIHFIHKKREMDIKKQINEIPIKVSVVSVLIFIPLVLLLIIILEYLIK